MKAKFAITSNTEKFLNALVALENRASPEASWIAVTGPAGTGKSRTMNWWMVQQGALYLRALANWTPHWALHDLLKKGYGLEPARTSEAMFNQALQMLPKNPRPIVIDEIENAFHDTQVLETFRDLSDLTDVTIIVVGMEAVRAKLLRYEQISSRICQAVEFTLATLGDVRIFADTLCEVQVADDLVEQIHQISDGRVRVIMDALAEAERHAKRNKLKAIDLTGMAGNKLVHDWRTRRTIVARPSLSVVKEGDK
jgi:hypothetical protein